MQSNDMLIIHNSTPSVTVRNRTARLADEPKPRESSEKVRLSHLVGWLRSAI